MWNCRVVKFFGHRLLLTTIFIFVLHWRGIIFGYKWSIGILMILKLFMDTNLYSYDAFEKSFHNKWIYNEEFIIKLRGKTSIFLEFETSGS
jgi:hypothetical protein